jgi:hypothetical protein
LGCHDRHHRLLSPHRDVVVADDELADHVAADMDTGVATGHPDLIH